MIPADCKNIRNEFNILLNELKRYNSELLFKKRLVAITKADIIDSELMDMLKQDLPEGEDCIFISSVTGFQITELKDKLWNMLQ
jgi:GTP-binding protein